jgi:D-glycero-alpha-D-manno-heptose-7-phosphate kinase
MVKNISSIKHLPIKVALKEIEKKIKKIPGLEIHYNGQLPARSGMGSSSSFVVGLLKTLDHYFGFQIDKKKLAEKSVFFEREKLKEIVGSQDQVAAAYGGFNSIKFDTNGTFKVTPIFSSKNDMISFSKNLFIYYTDINRTAKYIAKTYVKKLNSEKKKNMFDILSHVKESKKILKSKNYDDFGRLLNETWKIKRNLSKQVSSSFIDKIYSNGIKQGALGGKLLGAGGGGFVLFYVPKDNQKNFLKKMKSRLLFPVNFTSSGSEIVYTDE